MQVVLKRSYYGPDGVLYKRANAQGEPLVHTFPDDWKRPKGSMNPDEAITALKVTAAPDAPETLSALAKGRKKTAREEAAE